MNKITLNNTDIIYSDTHLSELCENYNRLDKSWCGLPPRERNIQLNLFNNAKETLFSYIIDNTIPEILNSLANDSECILDTSYNRYIIEENAKQKFYKYFGNNRLLSGMIINSEKALLEFYKYYADISGYTKKPDLTPKLLDNNIMDDLYFLKCIRYYSDFPIWLVND